MPVKIDDVRATPVPTWAQVDFWTWSGRARSQEDEAEAPPRESAKQGGAADEGSQASDPDLFAQSAPPPEARTSHKAEPAVQPETGLAEGEQGGELAPTEADQAAEEPSAPIEAADDLASQQQRAALTEDQAWEQGSQPATPLGAVVQENVDRLAGIQQLKTDEIDALDEGSPTGSKSPHRRRTTEERVADNAKAVADGAPPKRGRSARAVGPSVQ